MPKTLASSGVCPIIYKQKIKINNTSTATKINKEENKNKNSFHVIRNFSK